MIKNKSILVILPNFHSGGAERIHINLANEWVKKGFDVFFLVLNSKGELKEILDSRIHVEDMASNRIKESISKQKNLIKKIKPNVIVSAMWPLTVSSIISVILSRHKCKVFLVEHCEFSNDHLRSLNVNQVYFKITISIFYKLAHRIIAVSNGVCESLKQNSFVKLNNTKVIINGTPAINHSKITQTKFDLFKTNHPVILGVGTLKPQKDFYTLIKAFKLLLKKISIKLALVGDGEDRESLEAYVDELGIREHVTFYGQVNDVSKYFVKADIFVHSSFYDGMPLVLLEALAAGIQIVSTDTPFGPKEILANGTYGDIVEIGDFQGMAERIEHRLNNKISKEKLINRANEFSIDKVAKEYSKDF